MVTWEDIYSSGEQLNIWPYSEVVSGVLSSLRPKDKPSTMRFLEVGCGAGNNLWFAGRAGFQVSGIDISESAIQFARRRLEQEGVCADDLHTGDISSLPWDGQYFDVVVDRAALTHVSYSEIDVVLNEIARVLKPGGRFFSFTLFGLSHPDRKYGKEVAPNTYDHFTQGMFKRVGRTTFFDMPGIVHLFRSFSDVRVRRHLEEDEEGILLSETYSVACGK